MKVIAINGSPHKEGNTYHAIRMLAEELEKENIETEIITIGALPVRSCVGCGQCAKKPGACHTFSDDILNEAIEKIREADGLILGSPVHFAGISGAMKSFCDRLFYVATSTNDLLYHKVGAAVTAVRRSGGISAWDTLQHYLQYPHMIIATSNYWGIIHGAAPGEALQDEEGKQIMHEMGKDMAWKLKMRRQFLSEAPEKPQKVRTNFIR